MICITAFAYDPNSLHDPNNELAAAYKHMISLQSGRTFAWLIALVALVPGLMWFMTS
jgi:hypothetical protein